MNDLYKKALAWIVARNFRERVLVLMIALFVTLFLWIIIFAKSSWNEHDLLTKQLTDANMQLDTTTTENNAILQAANQLPIANFLTEQKGLNNRALSLNQRLEDMIPRLISVSDFQNIMNALLSKDDHIELISLKQLPAQAWSPEGLQDLHLQMSSAKIYKHAIQLEFHGSFFNTLTYLNRLENLPWRIYWESMQYRVLGYPEADVVVNFFVLSNQKT